jgi:hypothetical protein
VAWAVLKIDHAGRQILSTCFFQTLRRIMGSYRRRGWVGFFVMGLLFTLVGRLVAIGIIGTLVASYFGGVGGLPSALHLPAGMQLPWQTKASPYLDHDRLNGQPTGTQGMKLPWQTQTSPYVDHQGL